MLLEKDQRPFDNIFCHNFSLLNLETKQFLQTMLAILIWFQFWKQFDIKKPAILNYSVTLWTMSDKRAALYFTMSDIVHRMYVTEKRTQVNKLKFPIF